jgi:cytochrome c2
MIGFQSNNFNNLEVASPDMPVNRVKEKGNSEAVANFLRRGLALILVASIMFVAGFTMHKYWTSRHFPFRQLRNLASVIGTHPNPMEVLSQQYSGDVEKIALDRNIDTGLLPLKIKGIRISDHFPVPKTAGALTTVGDVTIVVDRLGNMYSCLPDGKSLHPLSFPALPNNVSDYLKLPDSLIDGKRFRAYGIKYLTFAKALAVSHEYFDRQLGKTRLAVSIIPIDEADIRPTGMWKTIFLGDPEPDGPNENGAGRLAAQAPDKIYLSVGDYGITSPKVSQDSNSSFGKIVEINLDTKGTRTISLGHRNPEGLVRTRSGKLWSTEHGPKGGDELNLITEGANYGWPNVSLGTDYDRYDFEGQSNVGDHSGYMSPVFAWLPSIASSNLIEVEGFDNRWNGDLLVASLKAMSLFRLRLEGTRVLYSEPIWIGQRIRDIAQLKNGTVVLWTDDTQLLFVSVDRERLNQNSRLTKQVSNTLNASCMYCHHFGATIDSDTAPTLTKLFSRRIGSDNFRYSAGLRNKSGPWTDELLNEFIADPAKFANGTSMPQLNLDPATINEIVQVLRDVDHTAGSSPN